MLLMLRNKPYRVRYLRAVLMGLRMPVMVDELIIAHIAYDGDALQDGSMDVRDLAPALLALGELLQGANRILNSDRATLAVKVQSDFKTGSFDIGIVLLQGVMMQFASFFGPHQIKTAKEIAEYVGLVTGVNVKDLNLLSLLKWLRGRKPDAKRLEDGTVSVKVTGDNNAVEIKIVRGAVYDMASDPICRASAEKVVKPLNLKGIDRFEVRKGQQVIETITKEDLPAFVLPIPPERILDDTPPMIQVVEVVKPSFAEDLTWTLSDGSGGRFDAVMKDPVFIERVQSGEDFRIGDLLRVTIQTHQSLTATGLRTRREVVQVIEEIKAPRQAQLLPVPKLQFKDLPALEQGLSPRRPRRLITRRKKKELP